MSGKGRANHGQDLMIPAAAFRAGDAPTLLGGIFQGVFAGD